jgi:hypothetical protein
MFSKESEDRYRNMILKCLEERSKIEANCDLVSIIGKSGKKSNYPIDEKLNFQSRRETFEYR